MCIFFRSDVQLHHSSGSGDEAEVAEERDGARDTQTRRRRQTGKEEVQVRIRERAESGRRPETERARGYRASFS